MYTNYRNSNCECNDSKEDSFEVAFPFSQNCSNACLNDCSCGYNSYNQFPPNPILGQSYTPYQVMEKIFKPSIGLKMGTIFPELVSPYMPGESEAEINYIATTNKIKEGCNKC